MKRDEEVQIKLARIRAFLRGQGLAAVLLKRQANFSWLTAGGLNMVGVATEAGVTSLLVTENKHYIIANRIEAGRMLEEENLANLGFEPLTHEWYEDREMVLVREVTGDVPSGCDMLVAGLTHVEGEIRRLRYELTPAEIERYLFLGERVAAAVEKNLTEVRPGETEAEITGRLAAELWKDRIDPVGYMAAADERTRLYRHPIPTLNRIKNYLMLCVNGRYKGLITSITRFVHFGPLPEALARQYRDNVEIECAMIAATKIGQPMRMPLQVGLDLYEAKGYGGEWHLHHQGGAMGYYARDIKATRTTEEPIRTNQAFCWNPSITGTKSEDGFIATPDGPIMVTNPVLFPVLRLEVERREFARPAILVQ